jgi:hypothetical protein
VAKLLEFVKALGRAAAMYAARAGLMEDVPLRRASARIVHRRPVAWDRAGIPTRFIEVGAPELVHNVITTVGRDFLHAQGYGTSGLGANGLNYIALSNDTLTETSASTVLSNEIAANGLGRTQGTVAHTVGTNTTTIDKTFTCATGAQAAQKAALFTAVSVGTMCHALAFTQRSLQVGDTLQITFTITLG